LEGLEQFDGTPDAFLERLVPLDLFNGLGDLAEIQATVARKLEQIIRDPREHREIATDTAFSVNSVLPSVVATAVKTVATSQGWNAECLANCLACNIGFLEHHETRLAQRPDRLHQVSPNIPTIIAAASSARKSSLCKFTTDLLVTQDTPIDAIKDRSVFTVDATLRGIRNSLQNYGRCSVCSDEIVNTYRTPWSENGGTGVNFLSRSKMNTYLSCERDDVLTGLHTTHIDNYSFQHKVFGQVAACEFVMRPEPHGSHKRMTFVVSEDTPRSNQCQECGDSSDFMRWMHSQMMRGPILTPEVICFDEFTQTFFHAVTLAIENFIQETQGPINSPFRVKLGFYDTDLIRLWNVNHRYLKMLLYRRWPGGLPGGEEPRGLGAHAFGLALRGWLRQLQLHHGFYKYAVHCFSTVGSSNRSYDGFERELGAVMANGGVERPGSHLDGMDRLMHTVALKCKSLSSTTVNGVIRNLQYTKSLAKAVADVVDEILDTLVAGGVAVNDPAPVLRARGRPVRHCAWKSWAEIKASPGADAFRARLGLGEDDFT